MPPHHYHAFPQIIFFILPCIQKFWVKGVQNKNIFDCRIHYPQCLSNLEAIGRKHFVKALPSEYSFSSTLRIFFSALPSQYSSSSRLKIFTFVLRIFFSIGKTMMTLVPLIGVSLHFDWLKKWVIVSMCKYMYCPRMSSVWSTLKEFFCTLCRTLILSKTCKLTVIWTWLTF